MKNHFSFFLLFLLFSITTYGQLQNPREFLGYELGAQFSRHADVVRYFEHVAENSNLVNYQFYGKTNERRPLSYAIISSEENLANLEQIRTAHLQNAGLETGDSKPDKAIVWLSYNVHGNEASSTEAAMKTLYELVTNRKDFLQNTVVIIDPCVNPDGRDRYANWYNQVKASPYNTSQAAAEHDEPWPGGRPNHYLFDLNRDWAWATQVETQQRLKIYNQWLPHIHVDFHEQGINDPYYFAPAAKPFHEIITPFQIDFQTKIGKNHAKYFDEEGWLYFTGERFDLLYPSYGDTYPTYLGAVGMTYEQAGNGMAGLGIQTDEASVLTLKDRLNHHFTTGISTVEVASQNAEELNKQFRSFFKNENINYKSYALKGDADKIRILKKLLDRHEINYGYTGSGKISGYQYNSGKEGNFQGTEQTLVVSTNQPKGKMVKVLFEPQTMLQDSLTYDITAWSLPYAYGLESIASTKLISGNTKNEVEKINNVTAAKGAGYISKWTSMEDARFLAALIKADVKVRFSEVPFKNGGEQYGRGSLLITKSDNLDLENFDEKVVEIANEFNRKLSPAQSSFADEGPDFGSSSMQLINNPKVALLRGAGTSSLNFGEIWYFFEQELNYPVTPIGTDYFADINLSEFDILIMPTGRYGDILDEDTTKKVSDWVKNGGKLIAIGNAIASFADSEDFDISENKITPKDTLKKGNLTSYADRERESIKDLITGSIIETQVDATHPMAFGYDDTYFTLKLNSDSYALLNDGYNVAYIKDPKVVSGFAGDNAKKGLKNSLVFGEERMGGGSFIYMVDNPLFRAFWENGKLFFVNSIFFVNNNSFNDL
ncbi:M14 family metallopeptidase [Gramella sp. AN32]|uniref:M14 family metallopeptidase n=1 Tax=Christiangramia antarctica TaxID=2058158 RepID=A0ABW5X651_9FLAO|nr:M14 family metallopeptidase [Gramella sp. AN32]MCM4154515.1 zinc carboxypeptidase [Gramella sp. AN32]